MNPDPQAKLTAFLASNLTFYRADPTLLGTLKPFFKEALAKLQAAVREGADFDRLKALSEELRIPLSRYERSRAQVPRKTKSAAPYEIWWDSLTCSSKVSFEDTFEAAFEKAKAYILSVER